MNYAGFWKRLIAYVIDGLLLNIVSGGLILLLKPHFPLDASTHAAATLQSVYQLIYVPFSLFYFVLMECSSYRGTIGKLAMGIQVTDARFHRIGFWRALARNLAKILSAILLGAGFIMIAFTRRKQGLHDMLASCRVINKGWD